MATALAKAIAGGAFNFLYHGSDVPDIGNGGVLGDPIQGSLVPCCFQCLVEYIHARAEYCLCVLRDFHDADLASPTITSNNLDHNSRYVPGVGVPHA